ncbi:MAG: hypothetical protein A2600_04330 [Candidatus Lambdaproteobacteria bacterium RIFOXYD1_FULL_56_27]|uniref:GMC family oxidoreductase n=1 Tax=Candidatus Lambdaproteobacteria bacterium RIFOXYD2_FULL_56_26 TaxID=1817773 RepID=A0A1F6H448_9PROT|nr:MAG: hypothetical protein A2426_02130 [Candidatus Lambdaproteobacteria bacterium RIFOXYC1_FULL_56_13]OGH05124.1 MAG: hypothetical protein A2557_08395 [Candidatus Lambdaproteobacteria bacterium RIFOXYD2_FULL_56_26]OGH09588.1 MAG: hypothetical protein A2600_04330 [Candidatus Lambdaproteobacteria bacterium RIFOXYD1_FULL_56_27]
MKLNADVVVIGSGPGGMVAAERLARAGLRVLLVEEGPYYRTQDLKMLESQAYPQFYQDSAARRTQDKGIKILQGRVLGGSSTVNWATCFRPPQSVLDHWAKEFGVSLEGLTPVLEQMEQRLEVREWETTPNRNNQVLEVGCTKLGYHWGKIKRNVGPCLNLGYCGLGCPVGAKKDARQAFLADFAAAGGGLLYNARAQEFTLQGDRLTGVTCIHPKNPGLAGEAIEVEAKTFILAAGAINGPGLQMRSNLPDPYRTLGKRTFLHPVNISGGLFKEPIRAFEGAPQTRYSDQFLANRPIGFKLEVPPVHPVLTASSLPGLGQGHRALMKRFDQIQVLLALHHDGMSDAAPGGRVVLDSALQPVLDYPITPQLWSSFWKAYEVMAEIQFAAGAEAVLPLHEQAGVYRGLQALKAALPGLDREIFKTKLASAHVMGGAGMSKDPAQGVVDGNGKHHQLDNLYVFDGSILPTSLGVNPQLTLFGLSALLSERLLAKLKG